MLADRVRFGAGGRIKFDPTTWEGIQQIVRANGVLDYFEIGSQFNADYRGDSVLWDLIGINHDVPTNKDFINSITIQSHAILVHSAWNNPNNSAYTASDVRAFLNGTFLNSYLDPELVAVIGLADKQVTNPYGNAAYYFNDKIFLLSRYEVTGSANGYTQGEKHYQYYNDSNNLIKKNLSEHASHWWLRTPQYGSYESAEFVHNGGTISCLATKESLGLAPALVIY